MDFYAINPLVSYLFHVIFTANKVLKSSAPMVNLVHGPSQRQIKGTCVTEIDYKNASREIVCAKYSCLHINYSLSALTLYCFVSE